MISKAVQFAFTLSIFCSTAAKARQKADELIGRNLFFLSLRGGFSPARQDRFRRDKLCLCDANGSDKQFVTNTLETLASNLAKSVYKNVIVVVGAGASTSAGIPDFRTEGTGLYDKLQKYNLPFPEAVFDISYYRTNPYPFVDLAKSLWPGQYHPTLAHAFVALLNKKGCLHRCYTQNIDGLERLAGVDVEKLVECHGHFRSASCTSPMCGAPMKEEDCKDAIFRGEIPTCKKCGAPAKPDIVFFGEALPIRFQDLIEEDMEVCDLLIVMGTSLLVMPVAGIPEWVGEKCPRLLINRELVGDFAWEKIMRGGRSGRDVFEKGDCDDGVRKLCQLAGWEKDLEEAYSHTLVDRKKQ